jgi:uncharacterized RDD family membrane protein YckC
MASKKCGFCDFTTDDAAAFTDHMRATHQWGVAPAPGVTAAPLPSAFDSTPKFCGSCGAARDSASTNFCRNCGQPFTAADLTARQEMSPAFAPKAGFWRRTWAYLLDIVVILVTAAILGAMLGVFTTVVGLSESDMNTLANVIGNVLSVIYFCWFWSGRGKGQTVGMRALGLRVIRTDGTYLSVGRAFLRQIGLGISTLAFGLGVLWIAWDKEKQGWHDKMADTYVVRA